MSTAEAPLPYVRRTVVRQARIIATLLLVCAALVLTLLNTVGWRSGEQCLQKSMTAGQGALVRLVTDEKAALDSPDNGELRQRLDEALQNYADTARAHPAGAC